MARKLTKVLSFLLCFLLIFEQSGFAQVAGQLDISAHILSLRNSFIQDKFRPLHLRSLSYDNLNNNFQLLLDKGDSKDLKSNTIEQTTKELLNYFFVGITLPNDSFWVNLRPDSPDNIIDPALGTTDVGKILLEADLQLKKDTAKFTSPETPEGKKYWDKLYKKAEEILGYENLTIPTLTRPWIVPGEIIIRETESNAYIYKATLKVMLEEDYLKDSATYNFKDERLKQLNEYSSQLLRELIIPKLTKEVNTAKRYASLRQVYYSLILAQWFKQKFYGRGGLYSWLIDKKELNGLTSKTDWSKTTYFKEYQKSFKEGEYNLKEPVNTPYGQTVRSYFSGGISFMGEAIKAGIGVGGIIKVSPKRIDLPKRKGEIGIEIKGGDLNSPAEINITKKDIPPEDLSGEIGKAEKPEESVIPSTLTNEKIKSVILDKYPDAQQAHIDLVTNQTQASNITTEAEVLSLYKKIRAQGGFISIGFGGKIQKFIQGFRKTARLHKKLLQAIKRSQGEEQIERALLEIFNERYKLNTPLTDKALSIYRSHPIGFIRFIEEGEDLTKEIKKGYDDLAVAEQLQELIEVFEISRDKGSQLFQIRNNESEYRHKLLEARLEKEYGDLGIHLARFAKEVNWDEYEVREAVSLAKSNKIDISTILGWFESVRSKAQSIKDLQSDLSFRYKTARLLLEHNVYDHEIISTAAEVIEVENSKLPEEIKHPLQSLDENQRLRLVLVLTGVSSLDSELATKLFSMVLEWKQQRLAERHSYAGQVDYRIRIIGEIEKALLEKGDLIKLEKLLRFSKDYEEKYRVEFGHARDGIWEVIEFIDEMISKSDKATLAWLKGKINDKEEIRVRVIKQYMFLHSEWHREVLEAIKSRPQYTGSFIVEGTQRSSSGFMANLDTILEVFNPAITSYSRDVKTILSTPILGPTILMTESILNGSLNDIIKDSQGNVYRLMEDIVDSKDLSTDFKIRLLRSSPADIIAKALKINIKLARYLQERNSNLEQMLERLSEPGFKEELNEISYNLNREITLHPAERRAGEDEKTSLFDLLFTLNPEEISQAKKLFDIYFRNNPDNYRIDIPKLNELLRYVGIDDIKKIIRSVIEDPKQSLDEIVNNIKQQVQGQPNADFVVRNIEWILSNLFVLQDKVEQLEPLSETLQAQGRGMEDFRGILEQIDKIKKFSALNGIATSNNLNVIDLLRLKLESISQEAREEILVDVLQAVDSLPNEQQKTILLGELSAQFSYQPIESQMRIYVKLLFNQSTDNSVVLNTIRELKSGDEISGLKKIPIIKQFFVHHRNLIVENAALHKYLEEAQKLGDEKQQKEALKQLRSLYQDRRYASSKFTAEYLMSIKENIEELHLQIMLSKSETQIPHIFFEPLLRIKPTTQTLDAIRELIVSMNANKGMRDQLATLKNGLNEKIMLFSTFDYNQKSKLFSKLLAEALARKYPSISVENANRFYDDLMFYLEQYSKAIDTYLKAKANLLPVHINEALGNTSEAVINELLFGGEINEARLKKLAESLAAIEAEVLFARFKAANLQIEETGFLDKLKQYAVDNPRFKWKDHEGRNIYRLIDIYLRNIIDREIYENTLEALTAEIDGRFPAWKYESEDYKKTIDEIIELEAEDLSEEEQNIIKKLRESAIKEDKTLYENLQKIVGFEKLKARIEKIKNWEKTAQNILGDGLTAEFTDDFYTLFNIGNYSGSTACQSCTYGNNLNRGLTGYVVNGTNKAVVLLDANRQIVTRRIVRLRLLEFEENGIKKRQPVIFVEESTQFGVKGIDELYALLDSISYETGLPVVASQHRPAQSTKVNEGTIKNYNIELYRGRSGYDYSDLYGSSAPGVLFAGLYRQSEPQLSVGPFGLLVKPKVEFDLSAPKTEMSAVPLGAQASHADFEVVLAASENKKLKHNDIHNTIEEGLPENLQDFEEKTKDEQNKMLEKYRNGDGQIIIPIKGLLRNAGLLGHIGLGQYYGEPVIYIEAELTENERKDVEAHELYEIDKWEAKRRELGLGYREMREWIRKNSDKEGTGLAQQLAQKWHNEAPSIERIFENWRKNQEQDEHCRRRWWQFQQGRVERIGRSIFEAVKNNAEAFKKLFKEKTGMDLENIEKVDFMIHSKADFLAVARHGSVQILLDLAAVLNDDELSWVLAHEFNHIQQEMQQQKIEDKFKVEYAMKKQEKEPPEITQQRKEELPNYLNIKEGLSKLSLRQWFSLSSEFKKDLEQKSQSNENFADEMGVFLVAKAGFDPAVVQSAFKKVVEFISPNLLPEEKSDYQTHPKDDVRSQSIAEYILTYETAARDDIYGEEDIVLGAGEDKKGGIDFRAFPIVTQPMQPSLGTVPVGAEVSPLAGTVPVVNLDNEWEQIQNMLNAGMVPSSQRIKDYLYACYQKKDFSQDIDKVLSCIADILRLEEERVSQTEPVIKEFLVLLESDKTASELQLALSKITVSPGEPKLVEP